MLDGRVIKAYWRRSTILSRPLSNTLVVQKWTVRALSIIFIFRLPIVATSLHRCSRSKGDEETAFTPQVED
jgi:hypothetical protein